MLGDGAIARSRLVYGPLAAGTVSVIDLRDSPQCQFTGRFEALQFYVPRAALDRLAGQHGARAVPTLSWRRDLPDRIVTGVSRALVEAAASPEAGSLLVDQLSLSLLTHFAETYGGMCAGKAEGAGRLAACQERRAQEIMRHRLYRA